MSSSYSEILKTILKQGNTATTGVTPKGKSKGRHHTKGETKGIGRSKPGSKTEWRERRQTTKWKTTPMAGARHVLLHSSEPHHPHRKKNGSREKGRGESGQEDLQRWPRKQWADIEDNSMG